MTTEEALFIYTLRLGDTNLILGQRLSEWTGHGPFLEEDLALTNIAPVSYTHLTFSCG